MINGMGCLHYRGKKKCHDNKCGYGTKVRIDQTCNTIYTSGKSDHELKYRWWGGSNTLHCAERDSLGKWKSKGNMNMNWDCTELSPSPSDAPGPHGGNDDDDGGDPPSPPDQTLTWVLVAGGGVVVVALAFMMTRSHGDDVRDPLLPSRTALRS